MSRRVALIGFIGALSLCGLVTASGPPAPPKPGDLDPKFGEAGLVTTEWKSFTRSARARAVLIQPDGRILAAGTVDGVDNDPDQPGGVTSDFGLARYKPDGSLDGSFNVHAVGSPIFQTPFADGLVNTDFGDTDDEAWAAALQADGMIVVAGVAIQSGGISAHLGFAIARYKTTGVLDSSFGTNGKVTTSIHTGGGARAVLIQPNGKIVAAGYTSNSLNQDFALARYHANGTLDPSFGFAGTGKVNSEIFVGRDNEAYAMARQSDGRIVLAGYTKTSQGKDFALARYTADGIADTTFGTNGKVVTDVSGSDDEAHAVAIQPDGKIVVGGHAGYKFSLVRYHSDGTLDATFDGDGIVMSPFGTDLSTAQAVLVRGGRIVAAGWLDKPEGGPDFVLARYKLDGTLDPAFSPEGQDGTVITNFPSPYDSTTFDRGFALAFQPDGKVIVAGESYPGLHTRVALARYLGDPPSPRVITTHLSGRACVPAVQSRAQGQVVFHLDKEGTELTWKVNLADVDGASIRLYDAEESSPNARLVPLDDVALFDRTCSGRASTVDCEGVVRDPSVIERLIELTSAGRATIVVTTSRYPAGELRGLLQSQPN